MKKKLFRSAATISMQKHSARACDKFLGLLVDIYLWKVEYKFYNVLGVKAGFSHHGIFILSPDNRLARRPSPCNLHYFFF